MTNAILDIDRLVVSYRTAGGSLNHAVSDVSLTVQKGESLGLVGESGCGKSSLAKAVMQFVTPLSGTIRFRTEHLARLDKQHLRRLRPKLQMIFQDSISSLNPRRTIGATIEMPLQLAGITPRTKRIDRVHRIMKQVGLDPSAFDLMPHQLSGGQCQRVQIARALVLEPEMLICDEPVSSLDVSIQSQILHLLKKLRSDSQLTLLFISHDLAVVKSICDRIAVMYSGRLCEVSGSDNLYQAPLHPYTKTLLSAVPKIGEFKKDKPVEANAFQMRDNEDLNTGCRFYNRCFQAEERCRMDAPELQAVRPDGYVACHYPLSGGV